MRSGNHSLEDCFNTNVSRVIFWKNLSLVLGNDLVECLLTEFKFTFNRSQVELSLARDFIFTSNLVSMFVDELITLLTAVLMVSP